MKILGIHYLSNSNHCYFSIQPPTFTPDAAIRSASPRPSYTCPSPPPPVSDLPFLSRISSEKGATDDYAGPVSDHEYRSSTPEQDSELEFFDMVIGSIKPLHVYMKKNKMSGEEENTSPTASIMATLPKSDSISSTIDERPVSDSFPSPPSQFNLSSKTSIQESTDGEVENQSTPTSQLEEEGNEAPDEGNTLTCIDDVDEADIELYQAAAGPVEFNKILDDIPEEEEEELADSSASLSLSARRRRLTKMDALDEEKEKNSKSSLLQLSENMSSGSLDSTVQDFDNLLQDLQESDLLEITAMEKRQGLSRQTSFAGPPPSLPLSLPPGPTLSPFHSISEMEGNFATAEFKNALKRLSITSLENALIPEIPETRPPDKLLSPHQSFSDFNNKDSNSQSLLPPPPPQASEDEGNTAAALQRHPSFLRHHFNPPEEFGNDSGLANTTDTEALSQEDSIITHRQSQLLQALRIADLENKTKGSSPSTSLVSRCLKYNYQGDK